MSIGKKIGNGTQSEVRFAELPGYSGPVAVKVGVKAGAIAREAEVMSVMSGVPGFPKVLHHEVENPGTPGGALLLELLGPSLNDLRLQGGETARRDIFSGRTLLRFGRELVRLLHQLHLAGFVHNDVKPANILLGADAAAAVAVVEPTSPLHLIDFGSCTRVPGHAATAAAAERDRDPIRPHPQARGPIGTLLFASVTADTCCMQANPNPTRPADDMESLLYTLAYLAAGSLPWQGQAASLAEATKRELLAGGDSTGARTPSALTEGIECPVAAAALEALYAEVRSYRASRGDDLCAVEEVAYTDGESVVDYDYEACLAAFDEAGK